MTIPINSYGSFGASPFFAGLPPGPIGGAGPVPYPSPVAPKPYSVPQTLTVTPASQLMGNVSQMVQFLISAPVQLIQQAAPPTVVVIKPNDDDDRGRGRGGSDDSSRSSGSGRSSSSDDSRRSSGRR